MFNIRGSKHFDNVQSLDTKTPEFNNTLTSTQPFDRDVTYFLTRPWLTDWVLFTSNKYMSVTKWLQLVIWSGGLIYITESPSVFKFACKISAWPDIKNAKCQSQNIQSQRLNSSVPDQHANQWHRFFSGRKMLLSLTVRLTDQSGPLVLTCREANIKKRPIAPLHRRQWNIAGKIFNVWTLTLEIQSHASASQSH